MLRLFSLLVSPRLLAVLAVGAAATGCRDDLMRPMAPQVIDPDNTRTDAGDARAPDASRDTGTAEAGEAAGTGLDAGPPADAQDAAPADAAPTQDVPVDPPPPPDAALPPDMPPLKPGCGSQQPDVAGITNADGLAIGLDGTIYFTQAGTPTGWIGRLRPGMAVEPRWVAVPNGGQLWGLAVDGARQRLYVSSAAGHMIHQVALDAAQSTLREFTRDVDLPDDLAVGQGGVVFFPDSDTKIYRVSPAGELETTTPQGFAAATTAVAFARNGDLFVGGSGASPVFRIALDNGTTERTRTPFGDFRGSVRGLAVDELGRLYLTSQGAAGSDSQLIRLEADGKSPTTIAMGPALRSLAFGRGALDCRDLYVASQSGPLRRITLDVNGQTLP